MLRPAQRAMLIKQHTIDTPYPVGPVHCYSAELAGELVLFDTGPPTDQAREVLRTQVDLKQLRQVVCTHCHIDHYGLAAWLEEEFGAQIYLPYRDVLKIERHTERLPAIGELLFEYGFSRAYIERYRSIMEDGSVFPRFPRQIQAIETSDLPERFGFEVLPCPGHSQSDLVYAGLDWAITGDVLLEGVFQSPLLDVDLKTGERFNNYRAYCQTLGNLGRLRERRILPGHREAITSVDMVILGYLGKFLDRIGRIRPELNEPSLAAVVLKLFGGLTDNPFHLYLKASEVIFMRDFLADPQRLKTALEEIGLFEPLARQYAAVVE